MSQTKKYDVAGPPTPEMRSDPVSSGRKESENGSQLKIHSPSPDMYGIESRYGVM